MPWTKYERVHTITTAGSTFDTTDNSPTGFNDQGGTAQSSVEMPLGEKLFQFELNGTGAAAPTILLEVRSGSGNWITAATINLTVAAPTEQVSIYRAWDQYRFTASLMTSVTNVKVYMTGG